MARYRLQLLATTMFTVTQVFNNVHLFPFMYVCFASFYIPCGFCSLFWGIRSVPLLCDVTKQLFVILCFYGFLALLMSLEFWSCFVLISLLNFDSWAVLSSHVGFTCLPVPIHLPFLVFWFFCHYPDTFALSYFVWSLSRYFCLFLFSVAAPILLTTATVVLWLFRYFCLSLFLWPFLFK